VKQIVLRPQGHEHGPKASQAEHDAKHVSGSSIDPAGAISAS
jgi:hypothetical protein